MSWFPRSEMKLVPSAQQVSGAPCKNRQLRFVALLFKVSERSITPVSIALCLQTPMKKQSASFHCCQAASHAHQRCHATHLRFWACVAFRLTEVNPHTLSLADLQFMCIPGDCDPKHGLPILFFHQCCHGFHGHSICAHIFRSRCKMQNASRPTDEEEAMDRWGQVRSKESVVCLVLAARPLAAWYESRWTKLRKYF